MTHFPSHREKVVILSGAGISAPSGLPTFRDLGGIWNQYRIEEVASPEAWAKDPATVLRFYNERRARAAAAQPNAAHRAIAALEAKFDVQVVTLSLSRRRTPSVRVQGENQNLGRRRG